MTHNHKLIGAFHDGCAACALDKLHGKAPAREPRLFQKARAMTDIARGPGGDGSPQLDLDAIERQALAQLDITRSRGGFDREASTTAALVALVRRLQQENEELRALLARVVPEKETP